MPLIYSTNEAQTEKKTRVWSDLQPLGLYPSRCEVLPSSEWLRQFCAAFWSLCTRPGQWSLDSHSKFTRSTSLSPFPGEDTDTREISAGGQDYLRCHVTFSSQSQLTRTSVGQTEKDTNPSRAVQGKRLPAGEANPEEMERREGKKPRMQVVVGLLV